MWCYSLGCMGSQPGVHGVTVWDIGYGMEISGAEGAACGAGSKQQSPLRAPAHSEQSLRADGWAAGASRSTDRDCHAAVLDTAQVTVTPQRSTAGSRHAATLRGLPLTNGHQPEC